MGEMVYSNDMVYCERTMQRRRRRRSEECLQKRATGRWVSDKAEGIRYRGVPRTDVSVIADDDDEALKTDTLSRRVRWMVIAI